MRNFKLILAAAAFAFAGCANKGGGGSAGVSDPAVTAPTNSAVTRVEWNDKQAACLDANQKIKYNSQASGTDAQCVDFSNQDLTGQDFSGYDLTGANFRNAILRGVKLDGATLKGLVLVGVEVDNACILQWLATGAKPPPTCGVPALSASAPQPPPQPQTVSDFLDAPPQNVADNENDNTDNSNGDTTHSQNPHSAPPPPPESTDPSSDDDELPSVLVNIDPTLPIQGAQEPTPEEVKIADFDSLDKVDELKSPADVETYFSQVDQYAQLGQLGTQLKLASYRLERQLDQSLLRVTNLKVKEINKNIASNQQAGQDTGALQTQLDRSVKTTDSLNTEISDLVVSIQKATQVYKKYSSAEKRAAKVAKLVTKFGKKYGDLDARLTSHEDFAATVIDLKNQTDALKAQLSAFAAQKDQLQQTIAESELQIDTFTSQIAELNAKIDAAKAVKEPTADLKNQRAQIQDQLAQAREQRAAPKKQIDELKAQIQVANQDLNTLTQRLREAKILDRIYKLLVG